MALFKENIDWYVINHVITQISCLCNRITCNNFIELFEYEAQA